VMLRNIIEWFLNPPQSAPRSTILIRLMAGGVFLSEGILKFVYLNQGIGRFTKIGIPAPGPMADFVAVLEIVGGLLLAWVGFQPPNEKVLYVGVALAVVMVVFWFAFERNRFQGPPTGEKIAARQGEIADIEAKLAREGRR